MTEIKRKKQSWKPVWHTPAEMQTVLNAIMGEIQRDFPRFLECLKELVDKLAKPCWGAKTCPYGPLVDFFPILPNPNHPVVKFDAPDYVFRARCQKTGHLCPVYIVATDLED